MILIFNCGSQSIKWKLFSGGVKKVAEGNTEVKEKEDFSSLLVLEMEKLSGYKDQIKVVGHRVVHGGGKYKGPIELNADILMELEKLSYMAPLHNPYNVLGVKTAQRFFVEAKQIAVFDTDFFEDLPEVAKTYALPKEISEKYGFKRYGFHGISHEYVANEGAKKTGKPINKLKIIVCHLGGGSSVSAIKNSKPVDVSMGFTPMEGVVMMTRSGNLDAGIVLKLAEELSVEKAGEVLNKESGFMGMCRTADMLEVFEKVKRGDKSASLALDIFVFSIKKYIGAYFAILQGCDLLVFTGSIGAGLPKTKNMILKGMDFLNKTKILTIKTDEELAIAQKLFRLPPAK